MTSKVLCRIETDPVAVFKFTQLNDYPVFWSPDRLSPEAGVLSVRVMNTQLETLGYIWGDWLEPGRFSFHACARRGDNFPWFGSDLLDQLCLYAFWIGADELVTNVDGHKNFRLLRRLLLRLGFAELPRTDGGSDFSLNLWNTNGTLEAADDGTGPAENPDQ